ncbi:MAG: hypothetical protein NZ949_01450 [Candidatus Kapabacteria bacterium]|nr:hypothetical protein [Candidatus Kapabacteria bacterium]MDW7996497.1 hypothetical protein [Bacteroidota bacterium]
MAYFSKPLAAGEIERAYARLLEGGPLADSVQQSQLVEQAYRLHERYGLPLGYEPARATVYGKILLCLACGGLAASNGVADALPLLAAQGWVAVRVVVSDSVDKVVMTLVGNASASVVSVLRAEGE